MVCRGCVKSHSAYSVPAPPLPAGHDLKKSCFVPSQTSKANQHLTRKAGDCNRCVLYILYILDPSGSCISAIHLLHDLSLGPLNVWLFERQPLHVPPTPGLPPTKRRKQNTANRSMEHVRIAVTI